MEATDASRRMDEVGRNDGQRVVLLRLGGDTSTQATDVAGAQASWKAYQEDQRRGKTK